MPDPPSKPIERKRYLGVIFPETLPVPGGLAGLLGSRLSSAGPVRIRIVRARGGHAIVEVPHTALPRVRESWNDPPSLRTVGTWGTLRKAKSWLAAQPGRPWPPPRRRSP